jgi:Fe-S cluster assembly ATP-binding protein
MSRELRIDDLHVKVAGQEILKGLSLVVPAGEVHAVMGPNGSGKSTLAHALAGKPGYEITSGTATLDGDDLLSQPAWRRARLGLFLAMQQPLEIPGVRPRDLLVAAGVNAETVDHDLYAEADRIGLRHELVDRFTNVDLSGGERKRAEIVQLGVLRPRYAVLDEVDSGLDVDALAEVARRIVEATNEFGCGVLAITHFRRLLTVLQPNVVHVLQAGRVVRSGGPELAVELERTGYTGALAS